MPPSTESQPHRPPFLLNVEIEKDAVQFVHLSEPDALKFLDHRMLQPNQPWSMIPWSDLHGATEGLPLNCDFLFHISHCGSTLISRLLANHRFLLASRASDSPLVRYGVRSTAVATFCALVAHFSTSTKIADQNDQFRKCNRYQRLHLVPGSRTTLLYVPLATFLLPFWTAR